MEIRFIVDKSDFTKVLSGKDDENFVVLRRGDGFFKNRDFAREHKNDDIIVYTDDETILNYAPFTDKGYLIKFKFPGHDEFIPISELHHNLRIINNLTAMYQKEIFHDIFQDRVDEKK